MKSETPAGKQARGQKGPKGDSLEGRAETQEAEPSPESKGPWGQGPMGYGAVKPKDSGTLAAVLLRNDG